MQEVRLNTHIQNFVGWIKNMSNMSNMKHELKFDCIATCYFLFSIDEQNDLWMNLSRFYCRHNINCKIQINQFKYGFKFKQNKSIRMVCLYF